MATYVAYAAVDNTAFPASSNPVTAAAETAGPVSSTAAAATRDTAAAIASELVLLQIVLLWESVLSSYYCGYCLLHHVLPPRSSPSLHPPRSPPRLVRSPLGLKAGAWAYMSVLVRLLFELHHNDEGSLHFIKGKCIPQDKTSTDKIEYIREEERLMFGEHI